MTSDELSSRDQSARVAQSKSDVLPVGLVAAIERYKAAVRALFDMRSDGPSLAERQPSKDDNCLAAFLELDSAGKALNARLATASSEDPRKADLAMEIIGGKLVISIGVEALAIAVEGNPMLEEGIDGDGPKVTDPDRFATELLHALQDEDEQGTNAVHRVIDEAALAAVESGAEGIRLASDEEDD